MDSAGRAHPFPSPLLLTFSPMRPIFSGVSVPSPCSGRPMDLPRIFERLLPPSSGDPEEVRRAGPMAVLTLWGVLSLMALFSEGIRSPTVTAYPVLVGAAALFWSGRAAFRLAIASVMATLAMGLAELAGLLPDPIQPVTIPRAWGGTSAAILMAGVVMYVTVESIRRALEAARESEKKFRDLINGSPDGMATLAGDGTVLLVNARLGEILGIEAATLTGRRIQDILPDTRVQSLTPPVSGRRVHARGPGGRSFPAEIAVSRVVSGGEGLLVLTLRDVSEEVRLEEEHQIVEARLRNAQKLEAVGRLAGGVAHDFNNLLTVILGNVSLELDRGDLTPEERVRWREVEAAADRAADLTIQLLAFSRKQILDPRPVELGLLVEEQAPIFRRILGGPVRLEVERSPEAWAEVDVGQMDTVLLNLIQNARDTMPGGGVVRVRTGRVDESGERGLPPGTYAFLSVEDTGPGMEADTAERIFEPFFTTKGVGEGTGLGLATVHGIVAQSGGHVLVESELGKGTTFRLLFPAIPAPPAPGPNP